MGLWINGGSFPAEALPSAVDVDSSDAIRLLKSAKVLEFCKKY